MKLATKVLSGFIVIALITCMIGGFGIIKIKQIDDADTMLCSWRQDRQAPRGAVRFCHGYDGQPWKERGSGFGF